MSNVIYFLLKAKCINYIFEKYVYHARCMMLLAKAYNNGTRKLLGHTHLILSNERGPLNHLESIKQN